MSDIVKFLADRLNEDAAAALEAEKKRTFWDSVFHPVRALREVKAKREIMQAHACVWLVNQWVEFAPGQRRRGELRVCRACEPVSGFMTDQWPCLTLKLLAAPYVDHPDYKQEWQVG